MRGQLDASSPLPRYYQIYSALLAMIERGELPAGSSLPPERHIAQHFGVARSTVVRSLALLAREGRIIKQQGRGNIILDKPARSPDTIAFVSSPHMTYDLFMGISQAAFERQYHVQVLGIDSSFDQLGQYLEACLRCGVRGFIVYGHPSGRNVNNYRALLARGVPVVLVDRVFPGLACERVVYDNERASYDLTRKLIDRGHQTLVVVNHTLAGQTRSRS